ncbi:MAG: flavodoxin family protein [Thermotogota bacterium]
MKILCISGSLVQNGNTVKFIEKSIEKTKSDIDIEIIKLSEYEYSDCIHCDWCLSNKNSDRICNIKDDAEELLWKIRNCDILLIATPVYFGRMTGKLASLIDRTRPFIFSTPHLGIMRDKIGVALSVAWGRNMGQETTLISIVSVFMIMEMIPISNYSTGSIFGAAGVTDEDEFKAEPENYHVVELDKYGINAAQALVNRAVDLQRRIKRK